MRRTSEFQVEASYPFLGLDDHEMMNRLLIEVVGCEPDTKGRDKFNVMLFWDTEKIGKAKTIAIKIRKAGIPSVRVKVSTI